MCFGYLLSTLFDHQADAMQCAIGSFYPMLLLSGILWPLGKKKKPQKCKTNSGSRCFLFLIFKMWAKNRKIVQYT